MCIKSDRIKFCTCATDGDNLKLEDFWILDRFNPDKDERYIGSTMLPTSVRDKNFDKNCELILKALNTQGAFDKPIDFKDKDCLTVITPGLEDEIIFEFDEEVSSYAYTFEFTGREWILVRKGFLDLRNHYDEIQKGPFKYY